MSDWIQARPCARCGSSDRCSAPTGPGRRSICRTASAWLPEDEVRADASGAEYALFGARSTDEPVPSAAVWRTARGDAATLDTVYSAMVVALWPGNVLLVDELRGLRGRGFSADEVARNGYWSHPADPEHRLRAALAVARACSVDAALATPGFYLQDGTSGLCLAGPGGLGIPVRDLDGRIVGVRVRHEVAGHKRYLWLTSPSRSDVAGCGAPASVHVPLHDPALRNGVVRVTEGELKADLATTRTHVLTVSVPGVDVWRAALPVLRALGARRVLLAYDGDARRKPGVAGALQRFAAALAAEGYEIVVEVWDARWKGIDDALVDADGGWAAIELHDGADAWQQIGQLVASAGVRPDPCLRARAALAGLDETVRSSQASAFDAAIVAAAAVLQRHAPGELAALRARLRTAKLPIRDWDTAVGDVAAAVDALGDLVVDFPFRSDADRAAWFAAVLTAFARFAFDGPAPLFLFEANTRGSGKSLLADLVAVIAAGQPMPRMAATDDDAEMRKRITTLLRTGARFVLLDNIADRFGTPSLDAALTGRTWRDRVLGSNTDLCLPLRIVWYGSGNNVWMAEDTARRVLVCRLESPVANPEDREDFRYPDVVATARARRPVLVAAALTILRAFFAVQPTFDLTPWGSFEGWSRLVRGALVSAGLPDRDRVVNGLRLELVKSTNAGALWTVRDAVAAGRESGESGESDPVCLEEIWSKNSERDTGQHESDKPGGPEPTHVSHQTHPPPTAGVDGWEDGPA